MYPDAPYKHGDGAFEPLKHWPPEFKPLKLNDDPTSYVGPTGARFIPEEEEYEDDMETPFLDGLKFGAGFMTAFFVALVIAMIIKEYLK